MDDKIKFYLACKDKNGNQISQDIIEDTIKDIVDIAGGLTQYNAIGYWKNQQGKIIKEKTLILEISCTLVDIKLRILAIAAHYKYTGMQESIMLEFNQEAVFV